jgi:hypothetical protein
MNCQNKWGEVKMTVHIIRRRPYLLVGQRCGVHTEILKVYAERGETPEETFARVKAAYEGTAHTPDMLGAFSY